MKKRNENQVKVHLEGGTGNQLFMYYAGLALASKNDSELILEVSDIGKYGTNHGSFLNKLNIRASIVADHRSKSRIEIVIRRVFRAVLRRMKMLTMIEKTLFHSYRSAVLGFDERLMAQTPPISLRGYFQTWRYFQMNAQSGNPSLGLQFPSREFLDLKEELLSEKTIVVHIRRGDYSKLSDTFGLLNEQFYLNGIRGLPEEYKTARIWIFSDDIEKVKKEFRNPVWSSSNFVNNSLDALENLFLMSNCDAIIIANSSYSYWGAMLGKKKYVIAPKKWFRNQEDPLDLLPVEWNLIDSIWEN